MSTALGAPRVLALHPFLVQGALSLAVLREMVVRGLDVTVAYQIAGGGGYTEDAAQDLREAGRVVDLSTSPLDDPEALDALVSERRTQLIVQIGAPAAYRQLPYLKERHPGLRIVDILYNRIGHTVNHFLYEACFDAVIVESDDMRRYVAASSASKEPVIEVVHSGVDLDRFRPAGDAVGRRGPLTVGYLGRMSPEKNPMGFVELAERLHARSPAVRFRMNGEGTMADEVRARIRRSPARDAITHGRFAPDVVKALQALDVLVVPSKVDGRPGVVMEAAACGVVVLGAPVGGIPELITTGVNGYVVAPTDVDTIAGLLDGWAGDRSSLVSISRSARALAERQFAERSMMDRYEAVFRDQVRRSVPPARPA